MLKYILVFIVFFSVLLNLTCKTSLEPITLNYFPLKVGNKWEYCYGSNVDGYTYSISINSTTNIGENFYYIYGHNPNSGDTLRIDISGRIWEYIDGQDYLRFDFLAANGSTYEFPVDYFPGDRNHIVTVSKNITVETGFGRFENCIAFYFDCPSIADEATCYIFAKNIGIVKMLTEWGDLNLYSYSVK